LAPLAETTPLTPAAAGGTAKALGRLLILGAGLAAAGVLLHLAGPGLLKTLRPTPAGAALMIVLGGLLSAAGMPRAATAFAGGYVFGAWAGIALALVAQLAGCIATFLWAQSVGRGWAMRTLSGRWARLHAVLTRHPFSATLTLRLLPVGSNLIVNVAAGLAGLPVAPFMAATALGYLPQTATFALLGSGVEVGRPAQLGLAAALFVTSAALGLTLARKSTPSDDRSLTTGD
jgi:uncharacterized membrane protein YdjX (TVP38/TMEM64 family)